MLFELSNILGFQKVQAMWNSKHAGLIIIFYC